MGKGLANVSELRALIEPGIAAHAATRARPSNLLRLEDSLARSSEFLAPVESLRLDIEFHVLLAHSAQNPLLATILEVSNGWAREVRLDSHRTRAARRSSIRGHQLIFERVRDHDATGAREAMAAHLSDVRVLISPLPDRVPGWAERARGAAAGVGRPRDCAVDRSSPSPLTLG